MRAMARARTMWAGAAIRWATVFGAVLLLAPTAAYSQDVKALEELAGWAARLDKPTDILSRDDARTLQEQLQAWDLPPEKLSPAQLADLTRVHILAALAAGDAKQAAAQFDNLRNFPDTRETLRAAWLVAGATGDAALGAETLQKLDAQKAAPEQAINLRLKRLTLVAHPAPEGEFETDAGKSFSLRERAGQVVVLTFIRPGDLKDEKHVQPLRKLYAPLAAETKALFLMAMPDASADLSALHKALAGAKLPEQCLTGGAALAQQLSVESTPLSVLIDKSGNVRAVGTAGEPEFAYAVRAAVAEAKGEHETVLPKTTDGLVAVPVKPGAPAAAAATPGQRPGGAGKGDEAKKGKQPDARPAGELPHNTEAKGLLDQARLYRKTGRKTDAKRVLKQIVDEYPGTWEAAEAKSELEILGG